MLYAIDECFLEIRNGANIKQGVIDGGIPITRIETISNDRFNRDKMGYAGITDMNKYKNFILEDEDLLMSHINSSHYLGRTVMYNLERDETIIHGMNLLRLKPNKEIINPQYAELLFYSRKVRNKIAKITKKSVNQASFSTNDLKRIKIDLPSVNTQKDVSKIFSKLNLIIDQKKQQINDLDNLIKSRFVVMFGNVIINDKAFPVKKMKEICPIVNYKGAFNSGKVWCLNLDMIESDTGRIIDYLYLNKNKIGNSVCTFDSTNVLYSKLRPYLNKVAIPERCGYGTSELVPLQPRNGIVKRYYIAFLLKSNEFVAMINEKATGAKMPRVSMNDLKNFNVPIPPIELQNEFATFVQQVDKSKFAIQKSLDETQLLYNALMQEYFG